MIGAPGRDVRRRSIRVALTATALVAIAYLVVSVAVVAIVTNNLTAQIDAHLIDALAHVPQGQQPGGGREPPPGDRPGVLPTLVWTVRSDGTVIKNESDNPDLPADLQAVSGPRTATIDGVDVRIAGAPFGDDYVVVAQTLDTVAQAQSTLVVAVLLIAPLLLLVVFLGAVAIGRRVATPIELARRRQLDFTADASHELRTPLSVIEAQTSLALAQERPAAWYRSAFERVDHEAGRMRRLVDDLLWLARFDATEAQPESEPVDLGVLAAQTADRFAVVAEARRLHLEVRAAQDSMIVAAPPEWLDRLLGVLLDNACKYAPDGTAVTVDVAAAGNRIVLIVDDAGPGIPDEERERVFDRFHRATDAKGGAGLGLAIADAIVRATGGRWQISTSPLGGARMSVSWPRALAAPREAVGARGTSAGRPAPAAGQAAPAAGIASGAAGPGEPDEPARP